MDFREAPSNAEACAWLRRTGDWPNQRLALWGEAGRGKTHLLHIWAARTGAAVWTGASLAACRSCPRTAIALDDADAVADEAALFHLLNAAGEAGLPVLLAGRRAAVALAGPAARPGQPAARDHRGGDRRAGGWLLRALLGRLLAERQLRVPEAVQEWLVQRLPRSAAALREAVVRLDAAALEQHRNITVPFAAAVLADLLGAG